MSLNKVEVLDVRIDAVNKSPVVILKDASNGGLFLPIWVGEAEAISIQLALERRELSRPLTHDLLVNLLDTLGAAPKMLKINRIEDQTYYAVIVIEQDEEILDVDCRPSDGIAIALRKNVPIFVDEALLYPLRLSEADVDQPENVIHQHTEMDHQQFKAFISQIQPKDFLKGAPDEDIAKGETEDD